MDPEDLEYSVLTADQRAYLLDEKEYTDDAERMARKRIRERLRAGMIDLSIIVNNLPLEDIDTALEEPDAWESGALLPISTSLSSLAALIYLGNREGETRAEDQPDGWWTASDVETGIRSALTRMGVGFEKIDVDIEVERAEDLETLAEGELTELSKPQLTQLHRAGVIDSEAFTGAWMELKSDDN